MQITKTDIPMKNGKKAFFRHQFSPKIEEGYYIKYCFYMQKFWKNYNGN